ncbi:MAG: hypothetical protein VB013_01345 [Anaerolineaceae bacterium]|nr:hypothetical protein [Anaerolineaceae bacterium]
MFAKSILHRILTLVAVSGLFLLSACNGAARTPSATPTPEATPVPPTPTPAPAEIVWVSTQPDASAATPILTEFASANSLQYRTLTTLDAGQINSGTRIVVLDSAPADLSSLAAAAPSTQFVVLGAGNISAGGNISVIQASQTDTAFMAGYLTMLIAEDWRAAGLIPSDSAIGDAYADAFTNGARFVCGKCNPYYAPLVQLPLVAAVPSGTDAATLQSNIAGLTANWLSAAFIDPPFVNADVVTAINVQAFNWEYVALITTDAAPKDVDGRWVARLGSDPAASLKLLLPELLNGQSGLNMKAQVTVTSLDEEIVTPAKMDLFNEVAAELASDKLVPTTIQ